MEFKKEEIMVTSYVTVQRLSEDEYYDLLENYDKWPNGLYYYVAPNGTCKAAYFLGGEYHPYINEFKNRQTAIGWLTA